jgi:hypothetical protein
MITRLVVSNVLTRYAERHAAALEKLCSSYTMLKEEGCFGPRMIPFLEEGGKGRSICLVTGEKRAWCI